MARVGSMGSEETISASDAGAAEPALLWPRTEAQPETRAPWVALVPAAAVVLVVLACNLLSDALEAALAGERPAA